ncbi:hypothetical protein AV530_010305 [Patagioenas fasciata monilis]|uniref:Uncharacterized protein n=1 Tax=Patagioenas fasciata monilis TaxID=372326 RepID=A0A1V4KEK8_PATFA|nr:hypothetical protein AV530_010305 [Patagioenas fasciata monilis]
MQDPLCLMVMRTGKKATEEQRAEGLQDLSTPTRTRHPEDKLLFVPGWVMKRFCKKYCNLKTTTVLYFTNMLWIRSHFSSFVVVYKKGYKHSPTIANNALAALIDTVKVPLGIGIYQYIDEILVGGDNKEQVGQDKRKMDNPEHSYQGTYGRVDEAPAETGRWLESVFGMKVTPGRHQQTIQEASLQLETLMHDIT